MVSAFATPLIIMSLFRMVLGKCERCQVAPVAAELSPSLHFLSDYSPSAVIISEEERWRRYCKEMQQF